MRLTQGISKQCPFGFKKREKNPSSVISDPHTNSHSSWQSDLLYDGSRRSTPQKQALGWDNSSGAIWISEMASNLKSRRQSLHDVFELAQPVCFLPLCSFSLVPITLMYSFKNVLRLLIYF
jgi:hypothetical protein